jgi:hypothetical protein
MSRPNVTDTYVSSSVSLIQPYIAAYMDFSGSAPLRLWTGIQSASFTDISGSGNYLGIGTLGNITSVTETTEIAAKNIDLTLSGLPINDYVSLALSNNYRGRDVVVYLILYNTGMTSYEQLTLFRGRMDQLIINEGSDSLSITVKCESRLIDLNRPNDIRYTDEAQKELYPNDKGLEFVASMADKSIYWGTSAPASTGNGAGDGTGDGEGTGMGS